MIRQKLQKTGGKLFAFFIDFNTAFPSLNHEILWVKLERAGVSKKFINICKSLYNKAKIVIVTEDGMTEEIDVFEGVLQGETLSGELFNAFINDLIIMIIMFELKGVIIETNKEVQALGFADDYVLFASDEQGMRDKIEFVDNYCKENKLSLNIGKSKVVIFHKGNLKKMKFMYRGKELEIVKSIRYLGIEFSNSGSYLRYFESKLKIYYKYSSM